MPDTAQSSASSSTTVADTVVNYRPPYAWPTNNRTRRFIRLPERHHFRETDLAILRRSVEVLLGQQDERGSFKGVPK